MKPQTAPKTKQRTVEIIATLVPEMVSIKSYEYRVLYETVKLITRHYTSELTNSFASWLVIVNLFASQLMPPS